MKKGIIIGISDIDNNPIKNGDKVEVSFINYQGTDKEYVDKIFLGEIFYHKFLCAFVVDEIGTLDTYHLINHRSMTFRMLDTPKTFIEDILDKVKVKNIRNDIYYCLDGKIYFSYKENNMNSFCYSYNFLEILKNNYLLSEHEIEKILINVLNKHFNIKILFMSPVDYWYIEEIEEI